MSEWAMPKRIQLRRTKGWRKPEGAVVVSRPSKWGNPFSQWDGDPVENYRHLLNGILDRAELRQRLCYDKQPLRADAVIDRLLDQRDFVRANIGRLRGKDLCCWCPIISRGGYVPCHADVLLSLANNIPMDEVIRENSRWTEGQALR